MKTEETVVKTTSVKVKNSNDKLQLFKIFRDYTQVASQVNRDIFSFSGRDYKDYTGKIVLSSDETLSKWISNYQIKDVDIYKTKLKSVYTQFTESSLARGYVAYFCQDHTKSVNDDFIYLRNITQLPFKYKGITYDVLDGQHGYKYAIIGSIHERIQSYIECDNATNKEYKSLRTSITDIQNKILEKFSNEELTALESWMEDCKKLESDVKPCFFNFNGKFVSFFNSCLKPTLGTSNVIHEGTWITTSGKTVSYSCDKRIIDLLNTKYALLWNKTDSILNDTNVCGKLNEKLMDYDEIDGGKTLVELYKKLERKKEYSSFKNIDMINSPIKLKLGNNYVKFNLTHDSDKHTLTVTIGYPKSVNEDSSKNRLNLVSSYKRVGRGTKCYLNDLIVTEQDNKGCYNFKYKINGKKETESILKEPSIRLVIRNSKMDINNPKLSDFDFYIDLCFNTVVDRNNGFTKQELFDIRKEFSTSFPEIKNFGKQKNIDIKNPVLQSIDKPIRIMGIDLGIKNPYAYSIYEYNKSGNHTLIDCGIDSYNRNEDVRTKYKNARTACFLLQKILNSTKYFVTESKTTLFDKRIVGMFDYVNKFFTNNFVDYTPITHEDYIKWIESKKGVELINYKNKDNNWALRDWTYKLNKIIIDLNKDRKNYNEYCCHFDWIKTLESYRKLMNSYFKVGKSNNVGLDKNVTNFKVIYDKITNLKLDYIKKLANSIAEKAHKHGVSIVVTEKLDSMRGNTMNDKDKNSMFNLWPVGQIKNFIDKALSTYGILNADAEERNTSQVRCETGEWGYRGEQDDIDTLYFSDVDTVNADINASKNICLRYINKHTDYHAMSFFKQSDKYYVPVASVVERKRERGFLSKQYGVSGIVFELENDKLIVSNKKIAELGKKQSVEFNKKQKEIWYATDNSFKTWMSRNERNKIIESIEKLVKK